MGKNTISKKMKIVAAFIMNANVEAMTSKGLRAENLSKYTKTDASCNVGLTTKTFIGYSLCYAFVLF